MSSLADQPIFHYAIGFIVGLVFGIIYTKTHIIPNYYAAINTEIYNLILAQNTLHIISEQKKLNHTPAYRIKKERYYVRPK